MEKNKNDNIENDNIENDNVENDNVEKHKEILSEEDICDNKKNINSDTPNLHDLLNNFNSQNSDISSLFNNFSKGDLGEAIKQFTNVMSNNSKNSSENNIHNLSEEEDDDEEDDEDFGEDFELNLDKYFISKDGKNICDLLSDIKSELTDIKFKL